MFRLADLYFEERDIDKEFRKIFLQSFHPIKKRKITQKIEGMDHPPRNVATQLFCWLTFHRQILECFHVKMTVRQQLSSNLKNIGKI